MGLFSGITSGIGDLLGGGQSMPLNQIANQTFTNVSLPGASASFDPDSNTITSSLDPRHKQFQDQLFGLGGNLLSQFQNKDFNQVAADQFDLLSDIGANDRQLQSQALENRLFSQGLLGSTAGQNRMRAFQDAMANQSLQREVAARQFANNQRNTMFNQGLRGLGGVLSLDALGAIPVQLGSTAGRGRAGMLAAQRLNSQDAGAGFLGGALDSLGSFGGGGGFGDIFGQIGGLFGGGDTAAGGSAFDLGFGGIGGSDDMLGIGGGGAGGGSFMGSLGTGFAMDSFANEATKGIGSDGARLAFDAAFPFFKGGQSLFGDIAGIF